MEKPGRVETLVLLVLPDQQDRLVNQGHVVNLDLEVNQDQLDLQDLEESLDLVESLVHLDSLDLLDQEENQGHLDPGEKVVKPVSNNYTLTG